MRPSSKQGSQRGSNSNVFGKCEKNVLEIMSTCSNSKCDESRESVLNVKEIQYKKVSESMPKYEKVFVSRNMFLGFLDT